MVILGSHLHLPIPLHSSLGLLKHSQQLSSFFLQDERKTTVQINTETYTALVITSVMIPFVGLLLYIVIRIIMPFKGGGNISEQLKSVYDDAHIGSYPFVHYTAGD